jgi:hypothetical protein
MLHTPALVTTVGLMPAARLGCTQANRSSEELTFPGVSVMVSSKKETRTRTVHDSFDSAVQYSQVRIAPHTVDLRLNRPIPSLMCPLGSYCNVLAGLVGGLDGRAQSAVGSSIAGERLLLLVHMAIQYVL